jgi:hypothetical protein
MIPQSAKVFPQYWRVRLSQPGSTVFWALRVRSWLFVFWSDWRLAGSADVIATYLVRNLRDGVRSHLMCAEHRSIDHAMTAKGTSVCV